MARDSRHPDAAALWRQDRTPVRTSNLVMGETWTWLLRRRAGHDAAMRFLSVLEGSARVSVAVVDEAIDERAWQWLSRHDERSYSYVDATSFEIMRRERIAEAPGLRRRLRRRRVHRSPARQLTRLPHRGRPDPHSYSAQLFFSQTALVRRLKVPRRRPPRRTEAGRTRPSAALRSRHPLLTPPDDPGCREPPSPATERRLSRASIRLQSMEGESIRKPALVASRRLEQGFEEAVVCDRRAGGRRPLSRQCSEDGRVSRFVLPPAARQPRSGCRGIGRLRLPHRSASAASHKTTRHG